jgi:hypothetical protein
MSELLRIKRIEISAEEQLDVNRTGILVPIIQGFVGVEKVMIKDRPLNIGIISRLIFC